MGRKKLLTQVYTPYIIIIFLALVTVALFASHSLKKHYIEQTAADLEAKAALVQRIINSAFVGKDVDALCKDVGKSIKTRTTAIARSGKVLCDSEADPKTMENHAGRVEVKQALTGMVGIDTHYSKELSQKMMYVAIPVIANGEVIGVVRTSKPLTHVTKALDAMYIRIAAGGLTVAIIAALIALFVTRKIVRPIETVKEGAERYAKGDFEYRLRVSGAEELATLAETLNKMALQLMRLETMRRDFVSNVSHELMTPITSIKGFVETLIDGAMKDPTKTEEFLKIISKHADRLGAIVEDLLDLSRIEEGYEAGRINFEEGGIKEILKAAMSACELKAKDKDVYLEFDCNEDIKLRMNPALFESAVVNLIDNAIKYSEKNGTVRIESLRSDGGVVIKIVDHGCGIPPEHLPRIFKRFYRVDKERSRQEGGTGLGLAIVRHIISAHGGHVHVESEVGKGSTFSIYLPGS